VRTLLVVHAILVAAALAWMIAATLRHRRRERHAANILRRHGDSDGPPTLHPVINSDVCIGSGACVRACPEDKALVIVDGRAHLAHASGCVGHGACRAACPVGAITLVFGTARRGVDLPELAPSFETSQRGLYIAGELGGMGLIATAVRQGVKAVEAIAASLAAEGPGPAGALPLLIVGAGPAGIAASLAARKLGIAARTVEKERSLGGAVRTYPRGKVVMTTPADLPLYGRLHLRRTSKAALIELWEDVFARLEVRVEFDVAIHGVERANDLLVATTSTGPIAARRVLLATGRRGSPRRLGVPGEEAAHVHHRIDEPEDHAGRRCVVIGGGDVAVEAALALSEQPGTTVTLCHRGDTFERARPENQRRLAETEAQGLRVVRGARVDAIARDGVSMTTAAGPLSIAADSVFVLIGSDLPVGLLSTSGVAVRTYRGEPLAALV
jgi:thioredoxin reductase/NAD-dependent dihydropyrimidine dehydrogenase PreA subunit